jgi:hypothetical protein
MATMRDKLIGNGYIKPKPIDTTSARYNDCTRKVRHESVKDAFMHGLGLAVKNQGRSRIYVCPWCTGFHVATDKKYEAQVSIRIKQLENELDAARESREIFKKKAADAQRELDGFKTIFLGAAQLPINRFLGRFGFLLVGGVDIQRQQVTGKQMLERKVEAK